MSVLPSSASSSTATSTHLTIRRRFDDRSQTAIALLLLSRTPMKSLDSSLFSQLASACNRMANVFKWTETTKISKTLNAAPFIAKSGTATSLALSPTHILVGLSKGVVAAFDYHQRLTFMLHIDGEGEKDAYARAGSRAPTQASLGLSAHSVPPVPVTCVASSSDGLFVTAGHMDGSITLWDISQAIPLDKLPIPIIAPYNVIPPTSPHSRSRDERVGHLAGTPISNISFVDDLHLFMVSADVSGLVLYHHGFKKFLRKHLFSEILLSPSAHSNSTQIKAKIFDCQILPVGTSPQITDQIGLMAIMSPTVVKVVSVRSLNNTSATNLMTHFKVSRSKMVDMAPEIPVHGCLAWYPCLKREDGVSNAKLAYSWNNVVSVLEINNGGIPTNIFETLADVKDKDKAIPIIPIFKTAKWNINERQDRVVAMKWLNSEILTVMVKNPISTELNVLVLYYHSTELNADFYLVGTDNLNTQQISMLELHSVSEIFQYSSYQSSIQIFRHRPVFLANSHTESQKAIFTGTTLKWADRLMQLLVRKDFLAALLAAYDFYHSTESGKLILCGLPHTEAERRNVVEPFLVNIMKEATEPLFRNSQNLSVEYELPKMSNDDLWRLYLHIVSLLTQNRADFIREDLLEIMEDVLSVMDNDELFFDRLEEQILAQTIPNLSPVLLEKLINHFVSTNRDFRLTEIICLLDSSSLNIDATLKLCDKHNLRECSAYIWNKLLHDYATPFVFFLSDLNSTSLDDQQKELVYSYLAYVLSGRQFPTDDYLSEADEQQARVDICSILFSFSIAKLPFGDNIGILGDDNTSVFPYLTHLLKFSVSDTLMALNEYFENPCLNDDGEKSFDRQYIVEALLDIFDVHKNCFVDRDHVYLAIFVARNYPKFVQFIRLSDLVLQETISCLCQNRTEDLSEDCELALQSLIQVYDVGDEAFFIEQLKAANFHNALFLIYKQKGQYSKAVEVWLKFAISVDNERLNFQVLAEILESTFLKGLNVVAKKQDVLKAIEANFASLVEAGTSDMVLLANTYCPDIHTMVFTSDSREISYKYLKEAFSNTKTKFGANKGKLLLFYVQLLCEFQPDLVRDVVKQFSHSLLAFLPQDDSALLKLKETGQIEAVSHIYGLENKHEEALNQLINGIRTEAEAKDSTRLERYIDAAIEVCENDAALWNNLVQELVKLTNSGLQVSMESLNQGIYRSFRKLLDSNPEPKLFQSVLHDIMESANVSNVRSTLQDILTSYFFEIEMLNISLANINAGVLKYLQTVRLETLKGWSIDSMLCTSCGLLVCGNNVPLRHFMAWEDRQHSRVLLGTFNKEEYVDCEVVLFKCQHGYHSKCLKGLGSWGHCVLCEAEVKAVDLE